MNINIILPELILFCGSILVLLFDIFFAKKNRDFFYITHLLSLLICGTAIALTFVSVTNNEVFFNGFYRNNPIIALGKGIIVLLLTFVILISLKFVSSLEKFSAEFLALMMIGSSGGMIMIASNDFLTFYLGLELQALSFYLLSAFKTNSRQSSEAGMKYFILGCLASGILLYGISLIYGFMGTTNFLTISQLVENQKNDVSIGFIFGLVMVVCAMFFKLANAPFHNWSPDVYQGSPTIVATLFASVGKFSAVLALTLLIYNFSWVILTKIMLMVGLISIIVGSFGAIFQTNLKRLLAYSSISHVGFIILGLGGLSKNVVTAVLFYIFIYSFISIASFAFLNLISSSNQIENDQEDNKIFNINSLSGLAKKNPIIAFCFAVIMFSSAGIPPLAGFFSKFYILSATISSGYLLFAIIAVFFSVVSAFYYLRIVKIMYLDQPNNDIVLDDSLATKSIIIFVTILNFVMIIFIETIFSLINGFLY